MRRLKIYGKYLIYVLMLIALGPILLKPAWTGASPLLKQSFYSEEESGCLCEDSQGISVHYQPHFSSLVSPQWPHDVDLSTDVKHGI